MRRREERERKEDGKEEACCKRSSVPGLPVPQAECAVKRARIRMLAFAVNREKREERKNQREKST